MRKLILPLAAAAFLAAGPGSSAAAQSRSDQASARKEIEAGRAMPLREIERRIVPQMKGNEYLGPEYDGEATAYRLKFIRDGKVVWVDVDARTARILHISK
jgi:uncharacterized membrane protein YkoI